MPFKNESQRRACYAQYNRDIKMKRNPRWDCYEYELKGGIIDSDFLKPKRSDDMYYRVFQKPKGGNIITDIYERLHSTFKGPRQEAPPYIRKFLETHGNNLITAISVCRVPINSIINSVLNVISLGQFNKIKNKLHYDDMFHLYLLISLKSPSGLTDTYLFERNQVIKLQKASASDFKEIKECSKSACPGCIPISIPSNLSFSNFLTNGELYQRNHSNINFYVYDAIKNNCQDFVMTLLLANNLSNSFISQFVKQSASDLLPDYAKSISRGITDVAGALDVLLHGKGCLTDFYVNQDLLRNF